MVRAANKPKKPGASAEERLRERNEAVSIRRNVSSAVPLVTPVPPRLVGQRGTEIPNADLLRSLRALQVLLRSARLYHKNHPRLTESLDVAYEALREVAANLSGLELCLDPRGVVVPKFGPAVLSDPRGELTALAADLRRAGIHSLLFARKFHVGELDTFAQLVHTTLLKSEEPTEPDTAGALWAIRLAEQHVEGIEVNTQTERNVDTVLTSLIGALVAYGGSSQRDASDVTPIRPPEIEEMAASLRLLGRLTPPLEVARGLSPEEAARGIHGVLEGASRECVALLLSAVSQHGPRDAERPQSYLLRLSECLIFEFLTAEFGSGALAPTGVRPLFQRLSEDIVTAGGYSGPHSSQHLSALAVEWANETHREQLIERFWADLPPRERSATLRGPDVWCIPVSVMRQTLRQLAEAGADAPRREARNILLNYARCLPVAKPSARRVVAAGLGELTPLIESLWPNQLPEELSRGALKAISGESVPETAALLGAFLETLARICMLRSDYAGFEIILLGLESAPHDPQHEHMATLAQRLIAQDRWLLLVDGALANRPLDPVLPRLLQRDPERLLDRLTLILTEQRGNELLSPMARLLRTIGPPALGLLETRLYEARRQRVLAAIKLLAAADNDRLLRALPHALASWEWNLQDLAVSEVARAANPASAGSVAFVFSAILADAHPLVVPMMIDQIGVANEVSAVPLLIEIAAGEHESLRDQYVRIKAIEALGRMRAADAAGLLHELTERRDGLSYSEPAGLRAAAEEALALIENRPSSARVRAAYETLEQITKPFAVHRRYTRIPLESPLNAQIEGTHAPVMRVRTISLGGAYLESKRKLSVGDSIKLEIRSGLRRIHSTAVVRNLGPDGNGIEFVHMLDEDREKLRRLVQRRLRD